VGSALLERERERVKIRRGVESALDGRGGVLLVQVPAGMGKSALLAQAP
jgi:ATP/maltotriose-dependent transcriptional regulator MalT